MDNELLVKSIRELCKKNNVAVSQLENDLNFGAGLISRWVKSSPSLDKIVDIADYFHVTLDEVVGYHENLDDDFFNKLYKQTEEKVISWELVTNDKITEYPNIKLYDIGADEYLLYNNEEYGQKHYVTKYNGGYIIMYSFYKYGNLLSPTMVKMFIQPTQESYLVEQNYARNTLLKLWTKILNSLGDNTPDEIKAEDLKNSFVLNKSKLNSKDSLSKKTDLSKMQDIMSSPEVLKLMEIYNQPEFKKMQETFNNPEVQAAIEIANKLQHYFDK